MPESLKFDCLVTDEGLKKIREVTLNPGWKIEPTIYKLASTHGEFIQERTYDTMEPAWYSSILSGAYPIDEGKYGQIIFSVVIPPNAEILDTKIEEIYFICKDRNGEEFLYGIAQPNQDLYFTPGVTQSYAFVFTINNINVPNTYEINYTFPQDIEDHNNDPGAHGNMIQEEILPNLPEIGEPRFSLTGKLPVNCIWIEGALVDVLNYPKLFDVYGYLYGRNDVYNPVSYSYLDNSQEVEKITYYFYPDKNSLSTLVIGDNIYLDRHCSNYLGTINYIRNILDSQNKPTNDWEIRYDNGEGISGTLFLVNIGTLEQDFVKSQFKLPNFVGRTIWGIDSNTDFGYIKAGLPNILGYLHSCRGRGTVSSGAFYTEGANHTDTGRRNPTSPNNIMNTYFDASRSSNIYGGSNTVQPPALKVRMYTRYQ